MKKTRHFLICAAAGFAAAGIGFSAAWTSGYEAAQRSTYSETLRALYAKTRNAQEIYLSRLCVDTVAQTGRRSDLLQYNLEHPGTYRAPAPASASQVYERDLAEQRKLHPNPAGGRPPR
jgi:hypothetical protein